MKKREFLFVCFFKQKPPQPKNYNTYSVEQYLKNSQMGSTRPSVHSSLKEMTGVHLQLKPGFLMAFRALWRANPLLTWMRVSTSWSLLCLYSFRMVSRLSVNCGFKRHWKDSSLVFTSQKGSEGSELTLSGVLQMRWWICFTSRLSFSLPTSKLNVLIKNNKCICFASSNIFPKGVFLPVWQRCLTFTFCLCAKEH